MKYRVLGRTGLKVSELGLGGHEYARFLNLHHFPRKRGLEEEVGLEELSVGQDARNRLIEKAVGFGVSYFDTGLVEECQSLGLALEALGRRREVYIAAESLWPLRRLKESPRAGWRKVVSGWVEGRLRLLQTDYVDVFNLHTPETDYSRERFEFVVNALGEIRDEGRIRAIGCSSHRLRFLAELIRKYDCFDSVMVPYNYRLQEAREVLFPLCAALDVGVVVMKPFCWPYYGVSFTHFCPVGLEAGGYTPSQMSLRWILESPEVSTVVPGTNTIAELEENLAVFAEEGKVDEGVLRQCLEAAQSPQGRDKLRALGEGEGAARRRNDIRSYARRALEGMH
ncbi:aldo/keto reductase [Candidatus Bathyarchaeota archaeon]|nr:aldo/keto reductase [Candidatus Bathyarchaeota archaeon]